MDIRRDGPGRRRRQGRTSSGTRSRRSTARSARSTRRPTTPVSAYIVVDTGPWIFGKKVMLPAGTIQRADHDDEKVFVNRTKDQIKNAPEFDEGIGYDSTYPRSSQLQLRQGWSWLARLGLMPSGTKTVRRLRTAGSSLVGRGAALPFPVSWSPIALPGDSRCLWCWARQSRERSPRPGGPVRPFLLAPRRGALYMSRPGLIIVPGKIRALRRV